jgi:hypothetical protein
LTKHGRASCVIARLHRVAGFYIAWLLERPDFAAEAKSWPPGGSR